MSNKAIVIKASDEQPYDWEELKKKIENLGIKYSKEKVEVFWQDNNEPENFADKESDIPIIGENYYFGDIVEINEFHQMHLLTKKKFGTWSTGLNGKFFVGTKEECKQIILQGRGIDDERSE